MRKSGRPEEMKGNKEPEIDIGMVQDMSDGALRRAAK